MSKRIYLRSLELTDCHRIHQWHNDPELYATLTGAFHPVGLTVVENWIKARMAYSEKEVNFAICLTDTSEHIGNMYLRDIDYINRNGFLGAFIGRPENRGKGYASEALLLAVEYAMKTLGLERLYMYVLADNLPARRHLERCGFQMEGTMRRHVFKNGVYKDVLVLGMCASDYAEFKKNAKKE
jgi:RimJ/RimL family protein N-acetyltransferase